MLQEQEPRRVPDRRRRDRSRAGMCLNDTCMRRRRHAVRVSRTCSLHFTPYLYLDCERKSCAPRRLLRALTAYPGQPVFCPGTLLTSLAIASHIPDYANVRSGGPRGVCACVLCESARAQDLQVIITHFQFIFHFYKPLWPDLTLGFYKCEIKQSIVVDLLKIYYVCRNIGMYI